MHFAQAPAQVNCDQANGTCNTGLPMVSANAANIQHILEIVFGIIAVVALIIIILSALQFVTAQGDPQGVSKARQAIIYAAIGLGVALSAEAIVAFVLSRLVL